MFGDNNFFAIDEINNSSFNINSILNFDSSFNEKESNSYLNIPSPQHSFIDENNSNLINKNIKDNEEEKEISEKKIAEIEKNSGKETHVALLPYKNFYEAEEYHQDYYLKNPEAFEKELIESGRKGDKYEQN